MVFINIIYYISFQINSNFYFCLYFDFYYILMKLKTLAFLNQVFNHSFEIESFKYVGMVSIRDQGQLHSVEI